MFRELELLALFPDLLLVVIVKNGRNQDPTPRVVAFDEGGFLGELARFAVLPLILDEAAALLAQFEKALNSCALDRPHF